MKVRVVLILILSLLLRPLFAQNLQRSDSLSTILLRSEVHQGRVLLRWAASDAKAWRVLNKYGVRLERLTIVRSGVVLAQPEVKVLADKLQPTESEPLKAMVHQYPMGAVMAQAVFGADFQVGAMGQDKFSRILSLDEEAQQRYMFSLFAADQCFPVAQEMGWGWIDESINSEESYLYRVSSLAQSKVLNIEDGGIFVNPKELSQLTAPIGLSVQFRDASAHLSWDYESLAHLYPVYQVERSEDGQHFSPVSDLPITRMAGEASRPNAPIRYIDSIENNKTYYYRIAGLSVFGSLGAYSDTIQGVAYRQLYSNPMLHTPQYDKGDGAIFSWDFPEEDEELISGFSLLNASDNKTFTPLSEVIAPNQRRYFLPKLREDKPYYIIEAIAKQGKPTRSLATLMQVEDSIPPAIPRGLTAKVDSLGVVQIAWIANQDKDILGYRLYKGNAKGEELVPVNDIPIEQSYFTDSVAMESLNTSVFYALTAIDKRYNQSELCKPVEAKKPELIPPTSPVILSIEQKDESNILRWASGGEASLTGFEIYRKEQGTNTTYRIADIKDKLCTSYTDNEVGSKKAYYYTIVAYTEGGLKSQPSPEYLSKAHTVSDKDRQDKAELKLQASDKGIKLSWLVSVDGIKSILLYKKDREGKFSLFAEGLEPQGSMLDEQVGKENSYMLLVKAVGISPIKVIKELNR